jgi:hypothetical protein
MQTDGPAIQTSTSDNRRTFDLWSLGADGLGGPSGADVDNSVQPEPQPNNPTVAGPNKNLVIGDDMTNWFTN